MLWNKLTNSPIDNNELVRGLTLTIRVNNYGHSVFALTLIIMVNQSIRRNLLVYHMNNVQSSGFLSYFSSSLIA